MTQKQELTKKELIALIKDIVADEAAEIFVETGIDFKFDHYDSDVKAVVVKELPTSVGPVEYDILKPLEKRLQEINERLLIYILYELKGEE